MRKTKIIATIGPSTRSPENLRRLIDAGCNVMRINMSHSSQEEARSLIQDIRTISERVAILVDTKGPEVRTTDVEEPVYLEEGSEVVLRGEAGLSDAALIRVSYHNLPQVLDEGTEVLIADGQIELIVEQVEIDQLRCRVHRGGNLGSKKGVNIPGVKLPMPFISEQDASDITFAAEQRADFVAASFVSEAEDIRQVRRLIERAGGEASIIAKIESRYACENLNEIVAAADGLMVARGDLGVEIPPEEVPVMQKKIIDRCRDAGRLVIVATEMLESMIHNPRPTRAETTDVANAIFEGADAVMLSGETSVGKYPFATVEMMGRIAQIAEREVERRGAHKRTDGEREGAGEVTDLICKSAWFAAEELQIRGILVPTSSGRTARRMSAYRPRVGILATTPDLAVARRLALNYGVFALPAKHYGRMENMVRRSCQVMVEAGRIASGDLIAVAAGVPVGRSGSTNLLSIQPVSELIGRAVSEDGRQ
ncbi:MAG: pyruvate kinase [Myxococcota bacterium]|nr:pyruvate kinase [Myxococcota bacterium]